MKKVKIIIISLLSVLAITSLIIIIISSNNKKIDEAYHTILESKSYVYEENRKMVFNVYSDTAESLIEDTNTSTYTLNLGNLIYELDNIVVRKYQIPESTLFKIETDIPNVPGVVSSDKAKLIINTAKNIITLNVGSISILNPMEYKLLGVDRLYASYSIVDGYKELVGINIKFKNDYDNISDFKIGEYAFGNFKQMLNSNFDNDINIQTIIPNYNIYRIERVAKTNVKKDAYFIPINYLSLMIIREGYITLKINDINYYIDNFNFMANDLSYTDYKDIMKDGEIK